MGYKETYAASVADPDAFWMEAAQAIDWDVAPSRALDDSQAPLYTWFADGQMNTCYNAVDRHVAGGRGDQVAILHDSPMTESVNRLTYAELQEATARLGGALQRQGVGK
ncbi:MAG: acetyl-coenzyme A synthetase N-terminal domain-containing protein, partial [Pseudomonadota bacterium]